MSTIYRGKRTAEALSTKPQGFDSQRYLSTIIYENVAIGHPISAEQARSLIEEDYENLIHQNKIY